MMVTIVMMRVMMEGLATAVNTFLTLNLIAVTSTGVSIPICIIIIAQSSVLLLLRIPNLSYIH